MPGPSPQSFVVVGAGLAGLASAWWLTRRGHRVVVLEAGASPAAEATAHNAGMVRRLGDDPVERALALRSHAFYERLRADAAGDGSDHGRRADSDAALQAGAAALAPLVAPGTVRRTGALLLLSHERQRLHDGLAHLRLAGVELPWLDRPQTIASRLPALDGAAALGGVWDAEALVVDAAGLCAGLLRALRAAGVEVRCRSRVAALLVTGGRCVGARVVQDAAADAVAPGAPLGAITPSAGSVALAADGVLLATGAFSTPLAASVGLHRPLLPIRRTLLHSSADARAVPDHPWVWLDDAGLYVRPQAGGWLGSPCDELADRAAAVAGPPTRRAPVPAVLALHVAKITQLLPALAGLRWQGGWSGLRTFAPDRAPLLGPDPALPGLHWCAGLGGFGVSAGVAAAFAAVELAMGARPPWLDAAACDPGRTPLEQLVLWPSGDVSRPRLEPVVPDRSGGGRPGRDP